MDKVKAGVSAGISKFRQAATESMNVFPFWAFLVIALVSLACLIVHIKLKGSLINATNVQNKTSEGYSKASIVLRENKQRKSLTDYLSTLPTDPQSILLSNFYFSTANASGLFFPANSGVYSPNAVRFAVQAGARAFVLDIWPSLQPFSNFRPIIHSVEKDSTWRRVSMNSIDVETVLEAIVSEVYTPSTSNVDYKDDVVLVYFRFRAAPRNATYDALAKSCGRVLAPYKVDTAFSSCRGNGVLFKTPITDLKGRVIVVSNKTRTQLEEEYLAEANERGDEQTKNPLIPYINLCPQDSIPVEIDMNAVSNFLPHKGFIQNSIVFVAPPDCSKEAETNNWGAALKNCRDAGIHCMAMNMFAPDDSNGFADFLFKDYFKDYSYRLKDESLRVRTTLVEPAKSSGDTGVATKLSTPSLNIGTFAPSKNK